MTDTRIRTNEFLYHLDSFEVRDGRLYLNGWLVHRREPLTHITLSINSEIVAERAAMTDRPDVFRAIGIPHSARSGLAVVAPVGGVHINGTRDRLEITAFRDAKTLGTVVLPFRDFSRERLPVPPSAMAERVGGNNGFLQTGLRVYGDIKSQVERIRNWSSFRSILDWGCGCGRIMRYALEDFPAESLHGCDIDSDAIDWDKKSIPGPSFTRIDPFPPTRYENESFDLIYGISIFTHLTEDVQKQWLQELRRISRPEGIVAVSVLGEAGAPEEIKPALARNGFADVLSPQSAEFAPYSTDDYYRVTYHSARYIFEAWSRYLKVREYVEFGINSHQDLVIMEKAD